MLALSWCFPGWAEGGRLAHCRGAVYTGTRLPFSCVNSSLDYSSAVLALTDLYRAWIFRRLHQSFSQFLFLILGISYWNQILNSTGFPSAERNRCFTLRTVSKQTIILWYLSLEVVGLNRGFLKFEPCYRLSSTELSLSCCWQPLKKEIADLGTGTR